MLATNIGRTALCRWLWLCGASCMASASAGATASQTDRATLTHESNPCGLVVVGDWSGKCQEFNLTGLPATTALVQDDYPEPYLVSSPCHKISVKECKACSTAAPAAAYQLDPHGGCNATRCFSLSSATATPHASAIKGHGSTAGGVALTYTGGDDGRSVTYLLTCNTSLPATAGPTHVFEGPSMHYNVEWATPLACPAPVAGSCPPPSPSPAPRPPSPSPNPPGWRPADQLARPTKAQLDWMKAENGAILHFNMGTYEACGIGADTLEGNAPNAEGGFGPLLTVPPPETFAPTNVNVSQWVEGLSAWGAQRAVLVVSHGCGFNTFPSRTAFPEFGFQWNYSVARSPWQNGKGDIAKEFVTACRAAGIKPGFYHGAMNNAFLGVRSGIASRRTSMGPYMPGITQDQYTQILLANLRQLWTDYGDLHEVWFDGGYPPGTEALIAALQLELQPNAVGFQGPGKNTIRWAGTEGGHVSEPFWSASGSSLAQGKGSPYGAVFTPGEVDTCFQGGSCPGEQGAGAAAGGPYGGCWFYNQGMCPKSLPELVSTYHDSCGHNGFLLLDLTPNQAGGVREDHMQRYAELGSWLTSCYGRATASVFNTTIGANGTTIDVAVPAGKPVDRIVLREDQARGQRILGFTVSVNVGGTWKQVTAAGQSVGNRFIGLFDGSYTGGSVRVNITSAAGPTTLVSAQLYNCSREPEPVGCTLLRDFAYKIVKSITISTTPSTGSKACCALCEAQETCAVFVVSPSDTCTLLSANQGGAAAAGWISGGKA